MFRIDPIKNRITKVQSMRFGELGFSEREHLQEWLANQPDALGEELLIIQKEFDKWDETKERLDLLAIDKNGFLVVIENKLDDSGKDVVWQALKYASYCSALSMTDVAEIFQKFLETSGRGGNAQSSICEFLGVGEFAEARLNTANSQRVILVAGNFRKEVTSTVLWLAKHDIDIKCFKATPYRLDEMLLLNLEQIIPLKEAEALMIGIAKKEAQETSIERVDATRHTLRRAFWTEMLKAMEDAGVTRFANIKPSRDHWISAGSGVSGVHYSLIFALDEARVEMVLDGPKEVNKALFDALDKKRGEINKRFGSDLEWRRLDDKKACIISFAQEFDGFNKDSWPQMIEWLIDHTRRLVATFEPEIPAIRQAKIAFSKDEPERALPAMSL